MSNSVQNPVDVSNRIMKYLYSKHKDGCYPSVNFNQLIELFLEGETIEKGLSNVVFYESSAKHIFTLTLSDPVERAREILTEIGVDDGNISISDIYMENPKNSALERLTYILG